MFDPWSKSAQTDRGTGRQRGRWTRGCLEAKVLWDRELSASYQCEVLVEFFRTHTKIKWRPDFPLDNIIRAPVCIRLKRERHRTDFMSLCLSFSLCDSLTRKISWGSIRTNPSVLISKILHLKFTQPAECTGGYYQTYPSVTYNIHLLNVFNIVSGLTMKLHIWFHRFIIACTIKNYRKS